MRREGAYRLRARPGAELFAAAWDRALRADLTKGHKANTAARLLSRLRRSFIRANPPKVTKLAKFVTPRFDPLGLKSL